jgi:hypothetical protein
MDRHGFVDVNVQGTPIQACYSRAHGHLPGPESLVKAFQGLVDMVTALKENYGHISGSGSFGSYGVGLARLVDSISPMAPPHPLALPDIHVARQFADMGRLYFRRSYSFLAPRVHLANSVGLVGAAFPDAPYPGADHYPWYLYHDCVGWRYAVISAIATGLRHRFYGLPQDLSEEDRAFAREWLAWEKTHLADITQVEEILEPVGLGTVDGYSYTTSSGAVVFLFNTSYDPQDVLLRLHLERNSDYLVRELYPRRMNYLGPRDGYFGRDSEISLTLKPKEARVIETVRRSPASAKRKHAMVFGAESMEDSGRVIVRGEPGTTARVGLRRGASFTVTGVRFAGEAVPRHIREWVYTVRAYEDGLGSLLPQGGFTGAAVSPSAAGLSGNVWLYAQLNVPAGLREHVEVSHFTLNRPCWAYPSRLFFVVRFEPQGAFDPIRTRSGTPGIPEGYLEPLPMKCGIDLTKLDLGLKAWVNGQERPVYPAMAAWNGYKSNTCPVVAYFFEAGSVLRFGASNSVVLFASHFDAAAFRGIVLEHLPELSVEQPLEKP